MFRHLVDYFELDGTFTLTVTSDAAMGYARVNAIDVLPDTPGIDDSGVFEGTYFQGVPITITALPNAGCQFSHWEGAGYDGETNPEIVITSDGDIQLTPVFVPGE